MSKNVIIIGAGPAGLTAALEILRNSDMSVTVLEATDDIGGISKTVNHKGNRIDIGGHRFFSKSDWVMDWWREILPVLSEDKEDNIEISYQNKKRSISTDDKPVTNTDDVMLIRSRLSRIYFEGNFFSYPVKGDLDTALKLGPLRIIKILYSYTKAMLFPYKPETNLEEFLINRFGTELYLTFFKEYTEKVWGVPCHEISAEWGAQRIKGLSISRAIVHAIKSIFKRNDDLSAKGTETSLIERFLYPKYGPGQMWETVARMVEEKGGKVLMHTMATGINTASDKIVSLTATDSDGNQTTFEADYVVSTMPVRNLIQSLSPAAPDEVMEVANGLEYRDFITVGLLLNKLKPTKGAIPDSKTNIVPDNWIYIQDKGVQVGRLQIFNNWSPYMVNSHDQVWIGLEYFCNEGDELWNMQDQDLVSLGITELEQIGLADPSDLLDSIVIRMPKAYPGYFGSYDRFQTIRDFTDSIENLYLVGRNGMHRYNNQDHSMLTARYAAESIVHGNRDKSQIWDVNIDDEYHEEK